MADEKDLDSTLEPEPASGETPEEDLDDSRENEVALALEEGDEPPDFASGDDLDDYDFEETAEGDGRDGGLLGRFGLDKRRLIIFGSAGAGGLVALIIGAFLIFGGGPPEGTSITVLTVDLVPRAAKEPSARKGLLTPPTAAGGEANAEDSPAGAPKNLGEPKTLNQMAGTDAPREAGPADGIVVAAMTAASFGPAPRQQPAVALVPAPDPALVEEGAAGPLPKIGADGREPWQIYKKPHDGDPNEKRIAIIVGGLGLSTAATQAAIERLPASVTLAFDSYAPNLRNWLAQAREAGHEVLISVPMEPANFPFSDPGPLALKTDVDAESNIKKLNQILGQATGYVGVVNVMGSQFAGSEAAIKPILQSLNDRGLMYVDDGMVERSQAPKLADSMGMPWAIGNAKIDAVESRAAISAKLSELEALAQKTDSAIGLAEPTPITIAQLSSWIPTLAAKKLVLAPISALAVVTRKK
ncbi:MAG: divergent polysaccharide deacetylase family protein [Proteobacteria bacterium]|nr:divergent polysaccharide deacetylase family protein [Pseudomonadota bacterium]